jgi:hypothetical protein
MPLPNNGKHFRCAGEHIVGAHRFYCIRRMGHDGEHLDCRGRPWRKLFPWNPRTDHNRTNDVENSRRITGAVV